MESRDFFRSPGIASVTKVRDNVFPEIEKRRNGSTGSEKNIARKIDRSRHQ